MKLNENREIWVNRVKDFKASNLTQKSWCEKNGIKISALRYWLRNLYEVSSIDSGNSNSPGFEFTTVSISSGFSSAVVLEINGVKLSLTEDYDEFLLLKLIRTLKKL